MGLAPGTRLGPFEITAQLGEGGMGEVYRARDTNLGRDVAIKVLPEAVAADAERIARFEREAKTLATLNHPNIAIIHGFEKSDGLRALVMELVEGPTLAELISHGPIAVDETLRIATQIAEGLEAAHEYAIVHRDLKPANVKVRPDGTVKVLDFGLARAWEPAAAMSPGASQSPTITTPAMTQAGVILGTAAYMSPEQARGHQADKRSDVWAFGCVLYEMLTGRRAFEGEDVADTLAAVLRSEPDWNALPASLPSSLSVLLKRCVHRDRRQRIGDIAAALFVLREMSASGSAIGAPSSPARGPSRQRRAASYLVVAVSVSALTSAVWWAVRPPLERPLVTRLALTLPDDERLSALNMNVLAISRDGSKIAYQTGRGLHVRSISDSDSRLVQDRAAGAINPVFSPDGEWVLFFSPSDRTLKKVSVKGGPAITLCGADSPAGMSWDADFVMFGQGANGILRVSENGGKPEVIASVQPGELAAAPQLLLGGDSFLFTVLPVGVSPETGSWDQGHIVVQSLGTAKRTTIVEGASSARYVSSGHLVYVVGGVLFARALSLRDMRFTGGPVPVLQGVRRGSGRGGALQVARLFNAAQLGVSDTGSLVYVPGPAASSVRLQLVLSDRDGKVVPLKFQPGPYQFPRSSPDGRQVVFASDDGKDASVWIYDLEGTTAPRRLTFQGHNRYPLWSDDGLWIAFQSDQEGDLAIFKQRADGTGKAERLTRAEPGSSHAPESWSPTGDSLLFTVTKGSEVSLQILSFRDGSTRAFDGVRSRVWPNAVFSRDGRRVAYSTREPNETRNTLYVEPFPPTGEKHQVAPGDAHMPVWSRDGSELFFLDPGRPATDGGVGFLRTTIDARQRFALSEPVQVPRGFNIAAPGIGRSRTFDIVPDGRFIGVREEGQPAEAPAKIEIVLNWFEELKRLVPTS